MNSTYTHNDNLSKKDNVLLYLKSKSNTWLSLPNIETYMGGVKHNTLAPILFNALNCDLLTRKSSYGSFEYKITENGIKYLSDLNLNIQQVENQDTEIFTLDKQIADLLKLTKEYHTVKQIYKLLGRKYPKSSILTGLERLINDNRVKRNDDYDRYDTKKSIAKYQFVCDNEKNYNNQTTESKKKVDVNDIIDYFNKYNIWATPAMVANHFGLNPKIYAGGMGSKLSKLYNQGTIIRKIEQNGIRYYTHINNGDNIDELSSCEPDEIKTPNVIENGVENGTDYHKRLDKRSKYLLDEGIDKNVLYKICFDALQSECDNIEKRKQQEILENKRTEQMKHLEDNDFVILEEMKRKDDEIQDLKDKLHQYDINDMNERAKLEHKTKVEILK